jgi:hypothetical protein
MEDVDGRQSKKEMGSSRIIPLCDVSCQCFPPLS